MSVFEQVASCHRCRQKAPFVVCVAGFLTANDIVSPVSRIRERRITEIPKQTEIKQTERVASPRALIRILLVGIGIGIEKALQTAFEKALQTAFE